MSVEFQDAVDWVERVSASWLENGKCDFADLDPAEPILCLRFGIYYDARGSTPLASLIGGPSFGGRFICSDAAGSQLLSVCEKSPAAYNLLREISADFILRDDELPPSLRQFAALHLRGRLNEPKKKRIHKTAFRNIWLLSLSRNVAADYDLSITRNDESRVRTSACDAVAMGLARNGHHISYRAAKEVCVGTTSRRIRAVSDLWVEAYHAARTAKIIPESVLDRIWTDV
ncbi:hypothetical protein M3P21_21150 [Ruegeria sp. 2012CJ41-6]|uniref:Uncharacterized protein n=1 Tax=Ruegeria spongiae TaxID=2942209 RepID=A0ABT0Q898_9RHOB|nr:hypothetical protein [Ruegeria spongiae]MCL6286027.1 hypothetical protein [Ruegeria spongiae]